MREPVTAQTFAVKRLNAEDTDRRRAVENEIAMMVRTRAGGKDESREKGSRGRRERTDGRRDDGRRDA